MEWCMPLRDVSPDELEGEALRRWYLTSPEEADEERQAAATARYDAFFGGQSERAPSSTSVASPAAQDEDVLWVANGRGGYRKVGARSNHAEQAFAPAGPSEYPGYLPDNAAAPEVGVLQEVGNPHNPRLRREWEVANNQPWPRTADGRPFDVAHIRAIADGGTNTLDNIRPMDPAEHRASHKDHASRFGRRSSIARTFGGTVEPPLHAPRRVVTPASPSVKAMPAPAAARPTARGPRLAGKFGPLGIVSDLLGKLSGRLPSRMDTWDNYRADLLGEPSAEDRQKAAEDLQRLINPNWKPGDPWVA